jgi:hypothetical protein
VSDECQPDSGFRHVASARAPLLSLHAGEAESTSLCASVAQTSGEAIANSDAAISPSTSARASRRGDPGSDASSGHVPVLNAGVWLAAPVDVRVHVCALFRSVR